MKRHQNSQNACCGNVSLKSLLCSFTRISNPPSAGTWGPGMLTAKELHDKKSWMKRAGRGSMWISRQRQCEPHLRHTVRTWRRKFWALQVTFSLVLSLQNVPCKFTAEAVVGMMSLLPKLQIWSIQIGLKNIKLLTSPFSCSPSGPPVKKKKIIGDWLSKQRALNSFCEWESEMNECVRDWMESPKLQSRKL